MQYALISLSQIALVAKFQWIPKKAEHSELPTTFHHWNETFSELLFLFCYFRRIVIWNFDF